MVLDADFVVAHARIPEWMNVVIRNLVSLNFVSQIEIALRITGLYILREILSTHPQRITDGETLSNSMGVRLVSGDRTNHIRIRRRLHARH